MSVILDLTGQRFERLLVLELCEGKTTSKGKWYSCRCDCGNIIQVSSQSLRRGSTKSCGCLNSELTVARNTTHGLKSHPLYYVWKSMCYRCYNEKATGYEYYGGRGIEVCDRWLGTPAGLLSFIEDIGEKPEGTSLDRINPDGNYCPENCRWATKEFQSFNRRHSGNSSSKKAGVYKFKKKGVWTGKWKAVIRINKKTIYLGTFNTEDDAIVAREEAELKYYGNIKPTL